MTRRLTGLLFRYPFFFLVMIVHRVGRDFSRCARKYGKDWDKVSPDIIAERLARTLSIFVQYREIVPYIFIPYSECSRPA